MAILDDLFDPPEARAAKAREKIDAFSAKDFKLQRKILSEIKDDATRSVASVLWAKVIVIESIIVGMTDMDGPALYEESVTKVITLLIEEEAE